MEAIEDVSDAGKVLTVAPPLNLPARFSTKVRMAELLYYDCCYEYFSTHSDGEASILAVI